MNKAIKIISIISICLIILEAIILFACSGLADEIVNYSFEHGDLEVGDRPATEEDLPDLITAFRAMFIVCGVIELVALAIPVLSIVSINKPKTFQLVLGIVAAVTGHMLLAIFLLVSFATRKDDENAPAI